MPLLNLSGLPERPEAFGALPSGIVPVAFERSRRGRRAAPGTNAWRPPWTASIGS